MPFPEELESKFDERGNLRGNRRDNPLAEVFLGHGAVT